MADVIDLNHEEEAALDAAWDGLLNDGPEEDLTQAQIDELGAQLVKELSEGFELRESEDDAPDSSVHLLAYINALLDADEGDDQADVAADHLHGELCGDGNALTESEYLELSEADRGHLVKKQITNKNGDKQTVWVNPARGEAKEAVQKKAETKDNAAKRSMEIASKVVAHSRGNGEPPTHEELKELSGHLQHLTRDKLVNVKNMMLTSFGHDAKRKQQMADSLRAHIDQKILSEKPDNALDNPSGKADNNSGGEKQPTGETKMDATTDFDKVQEAFELMGKKPEKHVPAPAASQEHVDVAEHAASVVSDFVADKYNFTTAPWAKEIKPGIVLRRVYLNRKNGKSAGYIEIKHDGSTDLSKVDGALARREIKDHLEKQGVTIHEKD